METRSIKELLIILRDNLTKCIPTHADGLCNAILYLAMYTYISVEERHILTEYLYSHKPRLRCKIRRIVYSNTHESLYWWTPGYIKPRLKWLNKQINKL